MRLFALLLIAFSTLTARRVRADPSYPTRPITMMVPFAAGGPADFVGRLVAEHMSKTLGQQIVIENSGGAGGTIAAGRVARAARRWLHDHGLQSGIRGLSCALQQAAVQHRDRLSHHRPDQPKPDGPDRAARTACERRQGAGRAAQAAKFATSGSPMPASAASRTCARWCSTLRSAVSSRPWCRIAAVLSR